MGAIADQAEEQKRQVLAAGAEAGKAGVQAFDAAQQQIAAQQQASVQRAHDISRVVGVTEAQNQSLDALAGTPFDRASASLAQSRGMYEANRAAADASNSAYFSKLSAIEPMIDALRAQSGSGGGGGGGGGRGGDKPDTGLGSLTDAQLGKYLMNQAVSARQGQISAAQSERDRLTSQREAVGGQRAANRKSLRQQGRLGKLALRQPQKIERRIERKGDKVGRLSARIAEMAPGDDRRDLRHRRNEVQDRLKRLTSVGESARRQVELRNQSKFLSGQIGAADTRYRELLPTEGGRPLSQDAKWIAGELGVDPVLAESLVGPTQDAQYSRAINLGQQQAAPNLYAEASFLHARPSEIAGLTGTALWKAVEQGTQAALAQGVSREENEQFLRQFLSDGKQLRKKYGVKANAPEVDLALRLAMRRYSALFPTLSQNKALAEAQQTATP